MSKLKKNGCILQMTPNAVSFLSFLLLFILLALSNFQSWIFLLVELYSHWQIDSKAEKTSIYSMINYSKSHELQLSTSESSFLWENDINKDA